MVSRLEKARAKMVVLHCQDPRFGWLLEELPLRFRLKRADVEYILIAGGAQDIILGKPGQDKLFFCLDVAVKHHGCSEITIINHEDCTAWGGSANFEDAEQETSFHRAKLALGTAILRLRYSEVRIRGLYALGDKTFLNVL
jgi:carbonic anhydrase